MRHFAYKIYTVNLSIQVIGGNELKIRQIHGISCNDTTIRNVSLLHASNAEYMIS